MKKIMLFITALIVGIGLSTAQVARVQVIHNSADSMARIVDVYINETLWIDNFTFRTATEFRVVPTGIPLTIGFAPENSVSVNDTIASFSAGFAAEGKYIVVANGIVSATGYSPAPAFTLNVNDNARESADLPGFTDVLIIHGATDAPAVDIEVEGTVEVVDDLSYGEFAEYMTVPAVDYTIKVTDSSGTTIVGSYKAPLSSLGLGGQAIVVVASGFLNPANNSNGPGFGLWVATAMGGPLVELTNVTAINTVGENGDGLELWPNPVVGLLNLTYEVKEQSNITIEVMNITGQVVKKFIYTDLKKGSLSKEIDMRDLNAGMYFINIKTDDKVISHKINKK